MDPTSKAMRLLYPWMDELMIETFVKAHENGTLGKYLDEWQEATTPPDDSVIQGAITVSEKVDNT